MLGLFGTLNLATRSLATQREGTEVAGHNLANVNNPAYARQRLQIQSRVTTVSELGPQGTGAEGVRIERLRNELLDRQILSEISVQGSLEAQQRGLEYTQANLGQKLDRQASGAEGAAATGGVGGQHGLAEDLTSLFNSFQSLSTNPTSAAERQVLLTRAESVVSQFHEVSTRLGQVHDMLNKTVETEVDQVNSLVGQIAQLNGQVMSVEVAGGVANDLRDIRQQRLEELGKLINFTATEQPSGALDITIGGVAMTSGTHLLDRVEAYDPGNGRVILRAETGGGAITPSGGSIQGSIEVRDGMLADTRTRIDTLAGTLISRVNSIHSAGYGLTGTTGEAFFTGTDAATIGVNSVLIDQPGKIQASAVSGMAGDNQIALALAQLADESQAGLGNQTLSENYAQTVARLGAELSGVNSAVENQSIVGQMLSQQRNSISGVSLDEEMTDLIRFQRAFQASARMVSTVDEMLEIVMGMKR